jgi:hypothetical protein
MNILFFFKIFVGALLIYRFTSRRKNGIVFTELDRKIAYSAGIFILVVSTSDVILKYSEAINKWAFPFTSAFVSSIFGTAPATGQSTPQQPTANLVVPSPTPSSLSPSNLG